MHTIYLGVARSASNLLAESSGDKLTDSVATHLKLKINYTLIPYSVRNPLKKTNPVFVCTGRSYSVFSQRMLNQCLESLVQKIQSGVVIKFEKTGPDPPPLEGKSLICSHLVPHSVPEHPLSVCCATVD